VLCTTCEGFVAEGEVELGEDVDPVEEFWEVSLDESFFIPQEKSSVQHNIKNKQLALAFNFRRKPFFDIFLSFK
jgi:hypothetical protein